MLPSSTNANHHANLGVARALYVESREALIATNAGSDCLRRLRVASARYRSRFCSFGLVVFLGRVPGLVDSGKGGSV